MGGGCLGMLKGFLVVFLLFSDFVTGRTKKMMKYINNDLL